MYGAGDRGINVILAGAPKLEFDFFDYPQLDSKIRTR